MEQKECPVKSRFESESNVRMNWTIRLPKKNTCTLKRKQIKDGNLHMSDLKSSATINNYDKEAIQVSENVPVDDENA